MAVKVELFGKNLDISDRVSDYVTKKAAKLDRYLHNIEEARVDLAFVKSARNSGDRQVAQITVRGSGVILRVEERADDLFAAFDSALDKMQRQIERFKGKRKRARTEDRTSDTFLEQEEIELSDEEEAPIIVRRKQFVLTPMDELEALEQMKLLGHDNFFVFYNVQNNSINVLYRRRDGNYGLIEPEVA